MKRTIIILSCIVFLIGCNQPVKLKSEKPEADSSTINKTVVNDTTNAPDRFRKQFDEGIDFLASGNEPFWSLEIDFDKSMHFKAVSGFEISTPAVEGVKAMDADVMRYHASTEKGILTVQLQKLECTNDMSGEKSEYSVIVDTKSNTDKDYTIYKGCGRYLFDYRLHDIWVLDSINDNKIKSENFIKGAPQLEFNLTEKKIFGHTGCNNLNGTIEIAGKKIRFGTLATTRMTCDNMNFESLYLRKLDNKTIPYFVKPGRLYLQVAPDSIFTYRKTD